MKWRRIYMTNEEIQKYSSEIQKYKYQCKCGKKVYIKRNKDKAVCDWCGKYVFKDKKAEFEYRVKEKLKNESVNN